MRSNSTRPADPIRHRAIKRDLAIERVSRLTTGTAIAGAVATVGFAGLAALTFTGNTTAADDQQTTDDSGSQYTQALTPATNGSTDATTNGGSNTYTNPQNGATGSTGSTGSGTTTPGARVTQPPTYYQSQPVSPPTVHRGRSHSSSGGS